MFGAVRLRAVCLRAVQAALYELFVHSEGFRSATQGVMLNLCNILCHSISAEIYYYAPYAVHKTARYNVPE